MTSPPSKLMLKGLRLHKEAMITSRKLVQSVVLSIGMLFAGASVVAYAGDYCPPDTTAKGNNGWGQEKNRGSTTEPMPEATTVARPTRKRKALSGSSDAIALGGGFQLPPSSADDRFAVIGRHRTRMLEHVGAVAIQVQIDEREGDELRETCAPPAGMKLEPFFE